MKSAERGEKIDALSEVGTETPVTEHKLWTPLTQSGDTLIMRKFYVHK